MFSPAPVFTALVAVIARPQGYLLLSCRRSWALSERIITTAGWFNARSAAFPCVSAVASLRFYAKAAVLCSSVYRCRQCEPAFIRHQRVVSAVPSSGSYSHGRVYNLFLHPAGELNIGGLQFTLPSSGRFLPANHFFRAAKILYPLVSGWAGFLHKPMAVWLCINWYRRLRLFKTTCSLSLSAFSLTACSRNLADSIPILNGWPYTPAPIY